MKAIAIQPLAIALALAVVLLLLTWRPLFS